MDLQEAIMLEAFSTPHNRARSLILLAVCGLLAIAAIVVGIDDNPIGISLAVLAAASFVLAIAYAWRSAAQFRRLIYVSALGFVLLLVLGVAIQILLDRTGMAGLPGQLLGIIGTAFLLGAAFVCIPGFLIGIIGAIVMGVRGRVQPPAV